MILFSVDGGDVGDCARTATLSVHVAIAAAVVRILRDIRFSFPHLESASRYRACVLRGRHLTLSRDIVRIVDQPRNSRVFNTCPGVPIDIPNANGANVAVDMSCTAADPYRFWLNPPARISNNSTGAMTTRLISRIACPDLAPSRGEMYDKARDAGDH